MRAIASAATYLLLVESLRALAVPAASLAPVGVLDPATPYSVVQALSPDGRFAVGGSYGPAGSLAPFLWTQTAGIQALPAVETGDAWACGVDVRSALNEIVIAGNVGWVGYRYKAPLEGAGPMSGAWTALPPAGNCAVQGFNALATTPDGDRYYIAGSSPNNCRARVYRYRNSTTQDDYWSTGGNVPSALYSVSASGTCVGYDSGGAGGRPRAIWVQPPSPNTAISSFSAEWSDGVGIGISQDGTRFTGYFVGEGGDPHAFRWSLGAAASEELLPWPGDTASGGMDISDAGIVVGQSWGADPATSRAVLWDTSGTWDSTGLPVLVQGRLAAAGIDTSDWAGLSDVVSISTDGLTITGNGVWAADGSQRGWVAVIPEPATAMLASLGLVFLAPRHRRQMYQFWVQSYPKWVRVC